MLGWITKERQKGGAAAKTGRRKSVRRLGGCELLEKIGDGGMGVVYRARQRGSNRMVAVKMLASGARSDATELARFRREAEIMAELHHLCVIELYSYEDQTSKPHIVMEYVEGGTISEHIRQKPLTPRESASLIATLARAVHAIHERGVIHCDLKPANVILSLGGFEESSDLLNRLVPKLADFGLARRLGERDMLTANGEIVGTPAYMAPEQASGVTRHLTPAVDVYGLGAILFECLTGLPPFQGDNPVETIYQVLLEEPVSPRQIHPHIPCELEAICLKCLAKRRGDRYRSAADLADELEDFLAGSIAVSGCRLGRLEHFDAGNVQQRADDYLVGVRIGDYQTGVGEDGAARVTDGVYVAAGEMHGKRFKGPIVE